MARFPGNVQVDGPLVVNGQSSLDGNVDVDGSMTVTGEMTVESAASFAQAVTFTDTVTLASTPSLPAGSIGSAEIADDAIDSQHYAAGSVDLEHMSANSVDSAQYVDGSVDPVHLASGYRTVATDGAVVLAATDRHINLLESTTGAKAATMTATHAGHRIDIVLTAASGGSYTFAVTGGNLTFDAAGEGGAIVYDGSGWIYAGPLTAATLV